MSRCNLFYRSRILFGNITGRIVVIALAIVAMGWSAATIIGQPIGPTDLLLPLFCIMVAVLLIIAIRPVLGGIAVISFALMGSLFPLLIEVGEFSLRYYDVMLGILALIVCFQIAIRHRIEVSPELKEVFVPLSPFFLYIGLSLITVYISTPDSFTASVASYIRLVVTALFAPLLHLSITKSRDMFLFHKGMIIISTATIAIGLLQLWFVPNSKGIEGLSDRTSGLLSLNSFGLVSGLLILNAFIRRDQGSNWVWYAISIIIGALGLFLAKSASSIFATAVALTVYIVAMRSHKSSGRDFIRWVTIGAAMAVVASLAVWTWRKHDGVGFFGTISALSSISGGSFAPSYGSFAHRLMIAYAGIQIFLENPLVGVGWQASPTAEIIGSVDLNEGLMKTFPMFPRHYFFLEKPTSVHNLYIQIIAELGIIGFALFAYGCIRSGKAIIRIVSRISPSSPYNSWAQFYALGLVFLLVWWNNQPLFGGQPESILLFAFLGVIPSLARFERTRVIK
jgi:O-antigen ligase